MSERGPQAANQVKELKVSGHTMTLAPGLYCVFNAADGPVPSADTGLPGVRLSQSPGQNDGEAAIVGFESGGWIGQDAAALIRVTRGAAEILVTVYQEANTTVDAPKLQVVRLSAEPAAAPVQQASPATPPDVVEVIAHVYGKGDVGGRLNEWMGEPGSNRWIEGFAVVPAAVPSSDIEYQAVLGRGWLSPWAQGGQFCGSRGMSLPILGLRVKLRGAAAESHRVQLTASFIDGTRVGPVHDGDACEAPSLAALEAFQLTIVPAPASAAAPVPAARAAASRAAAPRAEASPAAPRPEPAVSRRNASKPAGGTRTKAVATAKGPISKIPEKPAATAPASRAKAVAKAAAPASPAPEPPPARAATAKRAPASRRR